MNSPSNTRRRHWAQQPTMALGDEVTVSLQVTGRVVARTFGAQAYVDVVAPDGKVWRNIPAEWVATRATPSTTIVTLPTAVSDAA